MSCLCCSASDIRGRCHPARVGGINQAAWNSCPMKTDTIIWMIKNGYDRECYIDEFKNLPGNTPTGSYNTITRYNNCDILVDWGKSKEGYPANMTEGNMIDLAVAGGFKIIVKNGKRGKWYLKGKDHSIGELKEKINTNIGKFRDGVFCLLLE